MLPVDSQGDGDELDLRAYLTVLRHRWKLITAVALVAVVAALGMSLRQEDMFRVSSSLLVRQSDSQQAITGVASGNVFDDERQLNNDVLLFQSDAVVEAVAKTYDGPLSPGAVGVSATSDTSDLLTASATAADATEAAELVNTYVETFIEVRRSQRTEELLAVGEEIQRKVDDLEARIAEVRAPLTAAEARVTADPGNSALVAQRESVAKELAPQLNPLENQRTFYRTQLDTLDITADIARTSGVQVLSKAIPSDVPVSPTPKRDAAIALILGLVLGVGLAFLFDTLDERIRTADDLEAISGGHPTLALVPAMTKGHNDTFVAARDDPMGAQAEAFRSLRTAVKFAGLDRPLRIIQVTSPSQGEGKTTVVANLAVALAQGGDRVVVVCCDLRRPRIQERLGVDLTPGFTEVLLGEASLAEAMINYDPKVLVLPAGTRPPNPSELLASHKAASVIRALAEEFDVVLIDTPPVLPVTDALVVSRMVDATLVVVDSRSTARKAVTRALQALAQVNAPVLGIVLNGMPTGGAYGYGYGYTAADSGR